MSHLSESFFSIPYPELSAEIVDQQLTMSTPWLRIKADVSQSALEFARFCASNLHAYEFENHISEFLAPFSDFPVAFIRHCKPGAAHARPKIENLAAFAETSVPGEFDSLAALTCLRHKLLSAEADMVSASGISSLDTVGPEIAQRAVLQNFFVTSNCTRILDHAIKKFPDVGNTLIDFRNEELGHDKLLKSVLDKICPWQGGILAETRDVVALLEEAVDQGLLSFALGLELFEGIEFTSTQSPLAMLIRNHYGEEAARPLQKHYDINRKQKHGQIGLSLISARPIVTMEEIEKAAVIVEKFCSANRKLFNRIFLV